jgi:hypothetical protein
VNDVNDVSDVSKGIARSDSTRQRTPHAQGRGFVSMLVRMFAVGAGVLAGSAVAWGQSASAPGSIDAPLAASAAQSSSMTSFALFYGAHPPVDQLAAFDNVVLEPDSGFNPSSQRTSCTEWFAYVSVGEVTPHRKYYAELPKKWLLASNATWASKVVDQSQPGWPAFYVDHVIAPLWARGYRGFFLDTLDSYQLAAKTDDDRERQQAGLVAVIRAIKARYPDARLIFNRGFEILPQVHDLVYAVAFESLYQSWNQAQRSYTEVPPADREWLLAQAKTIREQYGLPVVSIDYCAPGDIECARDTVEKIRNVGLVPYITDGALATVGVGVAGQCRGGGADGSSASAMPASAAP